MLALLFAAAVSATAGVIAVNPIDVIHDAVGISYRFRVEAQMGKDFGKILFMAHGLYNPSTCVVGDCPSHQIEFLIGNGSHVPQVGECCWDGLGSPPTPPVCSNYNAAPWSGLRAGIWAGGKTDAAGLRLSDPVLWPRRTLGIDGSLTEFKVEAPYQRDVTGLDGRIRWYRGGLLSPSAHDDWGRSCLPPLPRDLPMREWRVSIGLERSVFSGVAVFPDDEATLLQPQRLLNLVTEFFEFPGTVRLFIWDVVVERLTGEHVPLTTFRVDYRIPGVPVGYWGVRKANYRGGDVLEFGTDPTLAYASEPGTQVILLTPVEEPPGVSVPTLSHIGLAMLSLVLGVGLAVRTRHRQDGRR